MTDVRRINGQLIGKVEISPDAPKVADSVLVQVYGPNDQPLGIDNGPFVRINGVTGARQYLQFARAGTQRIFIVAERNGTVERVTLELKIAPLPGLTMDPQMRTLVPSETRRIRFAIAGAAAPTNREGPGLTL